MLRRFWSVVAGSVLPYVAALTIFITIAGIPIAIYKFVCWQFVQQEILIEGKGIRDAFRRLEPGPCPLVARAARARLLLAAQPRRLGRADARQLTLGA